MVTNWKRVTYYAGFVFIFALTAALVVLGAGATRRAVLSDAYVDRCCSPHFDATLVGCRVFSDLSDGWCATESASYAAAGLEASRFMAAAFFFCVLSLGAWEVVTHLTVWDRVDLYE